jgi:hypothetical protein
MDVVFFPLLGLGPFTWARPVACLVLTWDDAGLEYRHGGRVRDHLFRFKQMAKRLRYRTAKEFPTTRRARLLEPRQR